VGRGNLITWPSTPRLATSTTASAVDTTTRVAPATRVLGAYRAWDYDDVGCFPGSASTLIQSADAKGSNVGYDGTSIPTRLAERKLVAVRPISSSPVRSRGAAITTNYPGRVQHRPSRDRGRLGTCNNSTGAGCTIIPPTDDGAPAAFYPFYSTGDALGGCA